MFVVLLFFHSDKDLRTSEICPYEIKPDISVGTRDFCAANTKTPIIPSGSFVYFQILSFVWFGIGAVFMLAPAKGLTRVCGGGGGGGRCQRSVPSEAVRKMNGALCWREPATVAQSTQQ